MMWRAILAFLALPGIVAFAVPLALASSESNSIQLRPLGALTLVAGVGMLLWCVFVFYASGKGTLAPWSPPKYLVTEGPYRFSRNPMYIAVALILIGWAILFWSATLAVYAAIVPLAFHIRVITGEEPWLQRTYGEKWDSYRARVRRWL